MAMPSPTRTFNMPTELGTTVRMSRGKVTPAVGLRQKIAFKKLPQEPAQPTIRQTATFVPNQLPDLCSKFVSGLFFVGRDNCPKTENLTPNPPLPRPHWS